MPSCTPITQYKACFKPPLSPSAMYTEVLMNRPKIRNAISNLLLGFENHEPRNRLLLFGGFGNIFKLWLPFIVTELGVDCQFQVSSVGHANGMAWTSELVGCNYPLCRAIARQPIMGSQKIQDLIIHKHKEFVDWKPQRKINYSGLNLRSNVKAVTWRKKWWVGREQQFQQLSGNHDMHRLFQCCQDHPLPKHPKGPPHCAWRLEANIIKFSQKSVSAKWGTGNNFLNYDCVLDMNVLDSILQQTVHAAFCSPLAKWLEGHMTVKR